MWIFDEDIEKRAPMFEYFKARKLIKHLTVSEINEESKCSLLNSVLSLSFWTNMSGQVVQTTLRSLEFAIIFCW